MFRCLVLGLVLLLTPVGQSAAPPSAGTITVDAGKPGAAIPSKMYGIFFEEISHAGDGGL